MQHPWQSAVRRPGRVLAAVVALLAAGCSATPESPSFDGRNLYLGYCAACHGATGAGDGPMAAELTAQLPDLRSLARRNGGVYPADLVSSIIDGRSYRAVHGSADMPVWGYQFRREEGSTDAAAVRIAARIEALVRHVGTLQR